MTVGDLRKALANVPDDAVVRIGLDILTCGFISWSIDSISCASFSENVYFVHKCVTDADAPNLDSGDKYLIAMLD